MQKVKAIHFQYGSLPGLGACMGENSVQIHAKPFSYLVNNPQSPKISQKWPNDIEGKGHPFSITFIAMLICIFDANLAHIHVKPT